MKAARIHEFGGPDRLQIEEVPTPKAEDGKAVVHIRAAGVNPVDWMIREHLYNPEGTDHVPLTLGQDFSGVIECTGAGANGSFRVGDDVLGEAWGAFAEYALVPFKDLVKKPESVNYVVAASIPTSALTAWQVVIDTAGAAKGKRFLIHGASGGVGSFAAQLAKWKGADVIATASSTSFDFLRSVGIDKLIDYHEERFEDMVQDVDVVVDPRGGEIQARSWSVLKKGGMLINLVGEIDEAAAEKAGVEGVAFDMHYDVEDLEEITELVVRGVILPHISAVLPFADARKALEMSQNGRSHGKIVLEMN